MTPLELILSEIPDFEKCRACGAALFPQRDGCGEEKGPGEKESPQPSPLSERKSPPKADKICNGLKEVL